MRPGGGRKKGHDWERAFAAMLRERGWLAKRGLQSRDGSDAADVVTDLPLWFECKAGRAPNVHKALEQALAASTHVIGRERLPPVAVVKADRRDPIACMYLEDLFELCRLAFKENQRLRRIEKSLKQYDEAANHEDARLCNALCGIGPCQME